MGFQETAGRCAKCGDVLIRRKTANHILHFLISFFTIGLWVIVWIICALRPGEWRCTRCGAQATPKEG